MSSSTTYHRTCTTRDLYFLFLLCLFNALTASAATYYVDLDNGDDSRSGLTRNQAWRTLPGMRNVLDSNWLSSDWGSGSISQSSKVLPGTTFKLKRGTTYNSNDGGFLWISKVYYATGANLNQPITIEVEESWGAGPVIFDFENINVGISGILIQTDGIKIDGKLPNGIVIQNCDGGGLQVKEKPGSGDAISGVALRNIKFYNNEISKVTDSQAAGGAQLSIRKLIGGEISNIELDGFRDRSPDAYSNGVLLGDNQKMVQNIVISNCVAYNHLGNEHGNDSGIGFKLLNAQVEMIDCVSSNNLKGWDVGHQPIYPPVEIHVVLNRCKASQNQWGMNFNAAASTQDPYTERVAWYLINSIVVDNTSLGSSIYSGPFEFYCIHSLYANNGINAGGESANLRINPGGQADEQKCNVFLYNNIFYKPGAGCRFSFLNAYTGDGSPGFDTDFSMDSDYNAWVQRDNEDFAGWSWYAGTGRAEDVTFHHRYGPDGPGHASGIWYSQEDEPGKGTGHLGCDAHSRGTSADDSSLPPFTDANNGIYTLEGRYGGLDLSTKSWFIPAMGFDRSGVARSYWDMGPNEYIEEMSVPSPPLNLHISL